MAHRDIILLKRNTVQNNDHQDDYYFKKCKLTRMDWRSRKGKNVIDIMSENEGRLSCTPAETQKTVH